MKFNIGSIVTIAEVGFLRERYSYDDIIIHIPFGFTSEMHKFCGKRYEIISKRKDLQSIDSSIDKFKLRDINTRENLTYSFSRQMFKECYIPDIDQTMQTIKTTEKQLYTFEEELL